MSFNTLSRRRTEGNVAGPPDYNALEMGERTFTTGFVSPVGVVSLINELIARYLVAIFSSRRFKQRRF